MNILLTGSTGFIGSQVARQLLEKGYTVRSHFRSDEHLYRISDIQDRLQLVKGDLFNSTELELAEICSDIDICIHCAWYAVPGKYLNAPENLNCLHGSIRLFNELSKAGCKRCVGIGTCFEYDLNFGYLSEATATKPASLYAAAKISTALIGEQISNTCNMSFAWARMFYLYGPYEDERRLIPYVINSLLQGKPTDISSGTQIRDYLHVEDAASAITAVAQSDLTGPVNIGSADPVKVSEIAESLSKIIGRPELLNIGARQTNPNDPPFICANNTKLRTGTDWKPLYDMDTGLRQTIEWWKEHLSNR
ncbi:MAG: NAD(P)-dependent oxidoreductase [Phycisphaerae bacterium]|nr:NAD(P)-dependent oxidoreductase [Phycisphaerae bacterium]